MGSDIQLNSKKEEATKQPSHHTNAFTLSSTINSQ